MAVNTKSVPAVRRAAAILSLLAERNHPMTLTQIALAVEILPSSCLHILRELGATRLIAIDTRSKTYRLGPKVVELARALMRQPPIAELVQPYLNEIADTHGVTATASALTNDEHVVLVAYAHPPVSMSLNVTLGGQVPVLSGAAGRCLAAFGTYTRAELRSAFSKVRWQSPLTFSEWIQEVDVVRRLGYSEDKGVFTRGVTTIAAPVFSPDRTVRCIVGVGIISAQLDSAVKPKIIAALKRSASDIGTQMS